MAQDIASKLRGALPTLPCTCANLRRAARAVTRLYNRELQREQIEITQFTLLMALDQVGEISQGKLGSSLALDSTTLTRTLQILKNHGWIQEKEAKDRRFRIIRLTRAGRSKLHRSLPHWKRVQKSMQKALGEPVMSQLTDLLARVAAVSLDA